MDGIGFSDALQTWLWTHLEKLCMEAIRGVKLNYSEKKVKENLGLHFCSFWLLAVQTIKQ